MSMRRAGLAHNTISAYVGLLRAFLNWANQGGDDGDDPQHEGQGVKETYSDEETELLLKKPDKNCDFCEYRIGSSSEKTVLKMRNYKKMRFKNEFVQNVNSNTDSQGVLYY